MTVQVVLVHGIRTSASMWRAQVETLAARGITATAVDLPGHGTRMAETFTLAEAFATIDRAVRTAAERGPVLLVGHSMGGLLCTEYAGAIDPPPIAGFVAASCTSIPRGVGLRTYRALARTVDALPDRGMWMTKRMLAATLPEETRADFGAGGYAFDTQDLALSLLATLDVAGAVARIRVPLWFVNGQYDQLRLHERLFTRLAPHAELIVVPRTSHLVTAMRPAAFDAVLALAIATIDARHASDPQDHGVSAQT
ncbi:alpha/beta hydrolase [Microbacterium sp. cx-55]|uniref:alpha/beta fold hydrolase n=1 Tax=Microbacterium sp. cx-55 TaxID=2875948 RepID=UPI001CBC95B9|nr:alpha/beta hydrolase [Microbacterium sp. cx-55]MBZ4486242.1 alpha/beta hydrolase [Microbacterium sp. cx-55]UGB33892.1 alpha/beta hydrolase [Microbacterium sp. cx-55]